MRKQVVAILFLILLQGYSLPEREQQVYDTLLTSGHPVYLIQISTRKEKLPAGFVARHFGLEKPVFTEFRDRHYRYYTGPFPGLEEAEAFIDSLGIDDAFAVVFLRGTRVTRSGKPIPGMTRGTWIYPPDSTAAASDTVIFVEEEEPSAAGTVAADTLASRSAPEGNRLRRFIAKRDYGRSTLFVLILYGVIIYSILTMMVLLVVILINRNRNERMARMEEDLKEKYQRVLMNYLFDQELPEGVPLRLQKIASNSFKRKILIDQMIDLSVNLRGDAAEKLRDLYIRTELHHDSIRKARSRRWHIKVKGFRELAFMDIRDANDEIIRCLHSRNDILRMEAQLALVKLGDEHPYEFLDYLKMPFSVWEQMTVHEMLIHHELRPPAFSRWLRSSNTSIVIFSLKMIAIFKQEDAYPLIIELLDHPDPEVRKTAIRVLGDVKYREAILPLKRMYKQEPYENCLEIIKAMGKMPDQMVLKFLQLVIDREDDVQLQIEAAKAIHQMGPVGEDTLEKMMHSDYKNYQIIIKHVLDKRIF
ncbi:MAG: HEAT repeat domain-containing protein [Bacteroidales bacterium]